MTPSHAPSFVRAPVKRWQGYVQARLLSREIKGSGVPTSLSEAEGKIVGRVNREWPADPARSKTRCMHGVSRRENREIPRSPASVDDAPSWMVRGVADQRMAGREGNAEAVSPR